MRRLLLLIVVFASACVPGVDVVSPPSTVSADAADLAAARLRWAAAGDVHYRYGYTNNCFCGAEDRGPFTVVVRDGEATAISFGGPVPEVSAWTVPELFDLIADHIDRGNRILVTYDETNGLPLSLSLDLDAIAVDGGLSLTLDEYFGYDVLTAELDAAEATWAGTGITRYRLTYRPTCFCPLGDVDVVVDSGVAVPDSSSPDTVEQLFGAIRRAIDESNAYVGATFHAELGYPTDLWYDVSRFIADEEWGAAQVVVGAL